MIPLTFTTIIYGFRSLVEVVISFTQIHWPQDLHLGSSWARLQRSWITLASFARQVTVFHRLGVDCCDVLAKAKSRAMQQEPIDCRYLPHII